jgi:hypothetical protein
MTAGAGCLKHHTNDLDLSSADSLGHVQCGRRNDVEESLRIGHGSHRVSSGLDLMFASLWCEAGRCLHSLPSNQDPSGNLISAAQTAGRGGRRVLLGAMNNGDKSLESATERSCPVGAQIGHRAPNSSRTAGGLRQTADSLLNLYSGGRTAELTWGALSEGQKLNCN